MFPHWETFTVFMLTAGLASAAATMIAFAWSLGFVSYVLLILVCLVPAFGVSMLVLMAIHAVIALVYKVFGC